ncbi:MAG: SAM-dependent methyltransferase [Balneolaceae bacterium]
MTHNQRHTLYLIPTPIARRHENRVLPDYTLQMIRSLQQFIAERAQTANQFLQWIEHPTPDYQRTLRVLNKKTPDHEVQSFLKLLDEGDVGLMSEAGAPGVADPGARLVALAHTAGHRVEPLVGPSALLLALMASGLNGQSFAFNGYLPIDQTKRKQALQQLEQRSLRENQTQMFMETPHRNTHLFQTILEACQPSTSLCIACNLTADDEFVETRPIYRWKTDGAPDLEKRPALFLLGQA